MADFGRNCARTKSTGFFSRRNSPKFLTREENLSKLSAFFFFCPDSFRLAASSLAKRQTSGLFSVIQLSNIIKNEKSGDFVSSFENFRVTAPKTFFEFNNSLNFYVSGAETQPLPLF